MSRKQTHLPACPRGDGGRVQRWGGTAHTFTEVLPRLLPFTGPLTCARCERPYTPTDAPPAPRKHCFPLEDIAGALFLVGSGWSYRAAGERTRRDAGIHLRGSGGPLTVNREFGLVADWVELLAPVLIGHLLPAAWPKDAVVLDTLPLNLAGAVNSAGFPARSGGGAAWSVLFACGYENGRFEVYRLHAVPGSPNAMDWAEFLLAMPGRPARVVSDLDNTILAGVRLAWPGMEHVPSRGTDAMPSMTRSGSVSRTPSRASGTG